MAFKSTCRSVALVLALVIAHGASLERAFGQEASGAAASPTDYRVGPQDVLTVTCYDQADLSGKFTVEADGTFTYPYIGRIKAGGLSLRALEDQLKKQLIKEGYFKNPQITVS